MQVFLCCLVSKISHDKMPKHGREEEQGNMIWVRIWMNTSCPSLLVDFLATVFGEWDVRDGAEAALGGIEVGLNLPQFDRLNASEKTTSKDLTLPSGVIKHGWKIYQFDDFPSELNLHGWPRRFLMVSFDFRRVKTLVHPPPRWLWG